MQTINGIPPDLSTGTTRTDVVEVPVLVRRGLERCWRDRPRYRTRDTAERVVHLGKVARSFEREARWWSVLTDWCYGPQSGELDRVFGRAVIAAEAQAKESAREYRRMAAEMAALLGGGR